MLQTGIIQLYVQDFFKDSKSWLSSSYFLGGTLIVSLKNNWTLPTLFSIFKKIPAVDTNSAKTLGEPIRLDKIITCIGLMQSNKAPGPDGFPLDFFKKFSSQVAP